MQVYKFGGASIATPQNMKALLPIVRDGAAKGLTIVVSAIGKTTNALEAIVASVTGGHYEQAMAQVQALEDAHNQYARELLSPAALGEASPLLDTHYTALHWACEEDTSLPKDYIYDQIVSIGELLSSTLFGAFLTDNGVGHAWLDARDLIRTDSTYRDAQVDWERSQNLVTGLLLPALRNKNVVVTQGFIGGTMDNHSTTLGREGSDYTAALLAAMAGAESVSIWKDVEGLLNADPKLFPNTVPIKEITYHEVIEMAYYGAQVIHPKTIKPLQNAQIPLYVKCFLNKDFTGTVIKNQTDTFVYPPLIILKKKQVLLQITSRDFSFVTEENLRNIYDIFCGRRTKINLIQNAAISLVACVDDQGDTLSALIEELEKDYKVLRNENVQLLTVRHYTPSAIEELTKGREILLEQKTRNTLQVIIK